MKIKEIKILLDSFYAGETSQHEELLLKEYFNSTKVAKELLDERELFLQFYQADTIIVPSVLEIKLTVLVDGLEKQEIIKERKPRRHVAMWASIAASVAVLLCVGIYMSNPSFEEDQSALVKAEANKNVNSTQFTEAEYMQAEDAMRLLSANFNKGMEQLDEMNTKLEETNNILNKTLKRLNSHEN